MRVDRAWRCCGQCRRSHGDRGKCGQSVPGDAGTLATVEIKKLGDGACLCVELEREALWQNESLEESVAKTTCEALEWELQVANVKIADCEHRITELGVNIAALDEENRGLRRTNHKLLRDLRQQKTKVEASVFMLFPKN